MILRVPEPKRTKCFNEGFLRMSRLKEAAWSKGEILHCEKKIGKVRIIRRALHKF